MQPVGRPEDPLVLAVQLGVAPGGLVEADARRLLDARRDDRHADADPELGRELDVAGDHGRGGLAVAGRRRRERRRVEQRHPLADPLMHGEPRAPERVLLAHEQRRSRIDARRLILSPGGGDLFEEREREREREPGAPACRFR